MLAAAANWPPAAILFLGIATDAFAHLAALPVEPFRGQSALLMIAAGIVLAALGTARFARRGLIGA